MLRVGIQQYSEPVNIQQYLEYGNIQYWEYRALYKVIVYRNILLYRALLYMGAII